MTRIEGRARTVRELLHGARYTIDFYQREYAWQPRQIRELVDDLTGKFLDFHRPDHARHQVETYGHYFLGSIVISHKRSQRFIVDGQQRLTTLTLMLIHLHHLQADLDDGVDVRELIFSQKYGDKRFNLDVPERKEAMSRLFHGEEVDPTGQSESVRNLVERYGDLGEAWPEEVTGDALPYFVDWLLENVHLVEIEAYNDEDAYTIFETMNDRGLSLSLPEMLKGYVLSNIRDEADQRTVNERWKAHMQAFKELGDDEDVDFFKNWLRARWAETIRPGKAGAENKDFERIGSEFHRWVRDRTDWLGLTDDPAFVGFVLRDLDFYARQTLRIRRAARQVTPGLESIRYNEERGFTLQTQLLLAALHPDDPQAVVDTKLRLVADFLDIWLARRVWNFRTIAYSSVRYTLFTFTKALRSRSVAELVTTLRGFLDEQTDRFATQPKLRLHRQNYRQIRHVLARLTHYVDARCGLATHFDDLVSAGRARPYEIEHIWADHYERFAEVYRSPADFEVERNRLGGLVLLQRGLNQSLSDAPYEHKRHEYAVHSQNLLARSLDPSAYVHNPDFRRFLDETGLPFRAYEHFGPEEQAERQLLYLRLAEWVWNPGRLTLGEVAPPVPEPLPEVEEEEPTTVPLSTRQTIRKRFWTRLLDEAATRTSLHGNVNPTAESWVGAGAGKTGLSYNYSITMQDTRVELYINTLDRSLNKALFDQVAEHRQAIEARFGGPLSWERMDDKNTARVAYRLTEGGWVDEERWATAIPATVGAMVRLHAAVSPVVPLLKAPGEEG